MKTVALHVGLACGCVVSALFPIGWGQQVAPDVPPLPPEPDIIGTNQHVGKMAPVLPPLPFSVAPLPAPTNSAPANLGLEDGAMAIPPDTHGAVGPNHVMTMLNSEVRIQTRTGFTNSTVNITNWWAGVCPSGWVSDPMLVYDPLAGRWIATITADGSQRQTNAAVLLAVSQTSDPTAGWHFRRVQADSTGQTWPDRPTLGFNSKWIAVQACMYHWTNNGVPTHTYRRTQIWLFNKTNLYAGGTNAPTLILTTNTYYQAPAVTLDNDPNLYLVMEGNTIWYRYGTNNPPYRFLRVFRVSGGLGTETMTELTNWPLTADLYENNLSSDWTGQRGFAPQLGSDVRIDVGYGRMQTVVCRNGSIWCAHMILLPHGGPTTNSAIQWWEISTNGLVKQQGRIVDPTGAKFYAYPSISANQFGDALIGYSVFSATQYAAGGYSFRAFNDQPNSLSPEVQYLPGDGVYFNSGGVWKNRWGDYSATVTDPLNDIDLWTIQEAAAVPDDAQQEGRKGRWKVRWAKVELPRPPNDAFAAAIVLSNAVATVTVDFTRATREPGEPAIITNAGHNSIWFRWQAPASGQVSIKTNGSAFGPGLAVFTGSALTNLTLVTRNAALGGSASGPALIFQAAASTTYQIAATGKPSAVSNVVLTLDLPSAPLMVQHPVGGDVVIGYTNLLTAQAIGSPLPALQWQFNGTNIAGATTNTYEVVGTSTNQTGDYRLKATNIYGWATSMVAHVKVWTSGSAPLKDLTFTNCEVTFHQYDVTNYLYAVQASTNLLDWENLATSRVPYSFTNVVTTNYPIRFYRTLFLGQ